MAGPVRGMILVRHADAGDPSAWPGPDNQRPLSPRGVEQAAAIGAHLLANGPRPDRIRSSPRLRAVQTAEIIAAAIRLPVALEDWLAEPFDADQLLARLRAGTPSGRRPWWELVVGHDPDCSTVLSQLTGRSLTMRKAGLAAIQLPASTGAVSTILELQRVREG